MIIYPLEALSRRFDIKDVPSGSLTEKGIVRLVNDISDDETSAISMKTVKKVFNIVNDAKNSQKSIINIKGLPGATFTFTINTETVSDTIDDSGVKTIETGEFGNCTVIGNYNGQTKTISVYIDKISTYNVSIYFTDSFANDSYETISMISQNGVASSHYAIGDVKAVTLNGKLSGALTFSSTTSYMQILAFDHNKDLETNGESHIVCGFGKSALSGGVDICFVDSKYGGNADSDSLRMNETYTTAGGWKQSNMRTLICSRFKSALPSDLQAVLRTRTLRTDYNITSDDVYIPSEFEVFGSKRYAHNTEIMYQKQLAYYANGNSKIRYKHSDTATKAGWWLRSTDSTNLYSFCKVYDTGGRGSTNAEYSNGFVPLITI